MTETEQRSCPGGHSVAHPAPALRADEYLCRSCVRHAERTLGDLPSLIREIETTATGQDKGSGNGGRRSAEKPIPAKLDKNDRTVTERARTVLALLYEWADFVAEWNRKPGLTLDPFNRIPLPVQGFAACAILMGHADWMRTNEQGPVLASAIQSVRRDLRRIVDRAPERLYAGPCEANLDYAPEMGYNCRQPLFRQWGGTIVCDGYRTDRKPGEVTPGGCGATHTEESRRLWLRADIDGRLLPLRLVWETLHTLVPGCQIDWETAKQWTRERRQRMPRFDGKGNPVKDRSGRELVRIQVTPPRLEPQSWSTDDEPLYRGSEILRLAEDREQRRGRRRRVNVA